MSPSPRRSSLVSVVALGCVAAMTLASCSSDKHSATTSSAVPSTDAKHQPRVSLALQLGSLDVQAVDTAKPFDRTAAKTILKLTNAYIDNAITRPLFTGSDSAGLAKYFLPSLVSRVGAKGRDRTALTDEHAPVITSVTRTVKQRLDLTSLQLHGRLLMVGGLFGVSVQGTTAQGPLVVSRIGHLVYERDSKNNWRISGYTLIVRRATDTASTTQKATTTTAAR
jgi:hypothetical protein